MNKKSSAEECELIGALIGDGHIYMKGRKHLIGFTGNQITDRKYYEKLKSLIMCAWNREVRLFFRWHAVRIQFHSKTIVKKIINDFGIPAGKGKCFRVKIPREIENNWELAKHTIRGIVDTDGSVFTANKPGFPNYPSIEITTTSSKLAEQLKKILSEKGFRVAKIWSYKSKKATAAAYKVPLNGKENVRKWIEEIGFSNPYKLERALKAV